MSKVVTFLENIPRWEDESLPPQENGRYTLLSLMDAMQSVPITSMQVLPHIPMDSQQQQAMLVQGTPSLNAMEVLLLYVARMPS